MVITPLFPLHTVLVPGGLLPLRIFEARYLDMVSDCLRKDKGFGVNLIEAGNEAGEPARIYPVGTYARIVDWQKRSDGLLGLTVEGQKRFVVLATQIHTDRLMEGRVNWLEESDKLLIADLENDTRSWLRQLTGMIPQLISDGSGREQNLNWISYRLLELLPLPLPHKQTLLELDDPRERLETLRARIPDPGSVRKLHT